MQKGFIQIPIIIAIFVSALVFGGGGYFVATHVSEQAPTVASDTTKAEVAATTSEIVSPQTATTTEQPASEVSVSKVLPDISTPAPKPQTEIKVETPTIIQEVVTPPTKDFKELTLDAISNQINAYKAITSWIDTDMNPLLSQRKTMLNSLISETNSLKINESDPSVEYIYEVFIDAYNLDKSQIVDFYRDEIFLVTKEYINDEKISKLNSEYTKFSAQPFVSEEEYNTLIKNLESYESNWKSIYEDVAKKAFTQYMSQTDAKDEMYQRLWADASEAISDLKKTQALEVKLNQMYAQQPKPLNCTFSSRTTGLSTSGTVNCY